MGAAVVGQELTDEEVFGAPTGELSDAEVFGVAKNPAPSVRQVGTGETASRAGSSFLHSAGAYAAAPVIGVARLLDLGNQALGLRGDQTPYADVLADRFVVPSLQHVDRAAINPARETAGPVGNVVIQAGGELGKAAPDLVMGAGLQSQAPKLVTRAADPVLRQVYDRLVHSGVAGVPAGQRRAVERTTELQAEGVDPLTAALQGTASGLMTQAQFALPASAGSAATTLPGSVVSRGAQGAALGTTAGLSAQEVENAILPEGAERLRQDIYTSENVVPQAVLGALFGQLGGRNRRTMVPNRAELGYDTVERAGLAPVEASPPRYDPPPIYDPQAAVRDVNEALFRTDGAAPQPPEGMHLAPRGHTPPVGERPAPDVSEVSVPVAPDWELEGIAGRMKREIGEPRIEPDDASIVRLTEAVERATGAMRPDVPMSLLKTIQDAARDSGLESTITPRVDVVGERPAPPVRQAAPAAATRPAAPAPRQAAPSVAAPGTSELERLAAVRIPGHYGKIGGEAPAAAPSQPPPATPPAAKPAREARKGTSFLQAIRKAGGIDAGFAADIGGDTAMVLNRRLPGLMRKGGMSADALREWAVSNEYITKADADRADEQGVGGAQELARALVRRAMADEDILPIRDQEAAMARDNEQRVKDERAEHAWRMETDPEYRAAQEAEGNTRADLAGQESVREASALEAEETARWAAEEAEAVDLKPVDAAELAEVARAAEMDENAVERLAMQHPDGGRDFMEGVRRIINGERSSDQAPARGEATEQATGGAPREGGAEARPELQLEQPTEAGLRAQADAERRAGEQRSRVEAAPPPSEFKLTGSERTADQGAAAGQTSLFDNAKSEPAKQSEDKPGGGTLYGGIPLDKIAKALGWATGDVKAWHDSIGRFAQDIADAAGGVKNTPMLRWAHTLFNSASGEIRSVLRKHPSATAQSVVDHFHTEAGSAKVTGETYSSAVHAWTNKQLTRIDAGLQKFDGNKQALEQIAALVRNPKGIKAGTPIHDAAKAIRQTLDDALKYMREAGVEIGEVRDGYYPREFDMRAVVRDSKGFIDAVARAYRDNGMAAKDATASAQQLHDGLVFGEAGTVFQGDRGSPRAPFMKGRVFGRGVDDAAHPLNKFLLNDPSQSIPIYLERAAKRAEIARRFGDNFSKWAEIEKRVIAEGGGSSLEDLREYVTLAAGLKAPGVSNRTGRLASWARTWGSLMFLEKATLSSLTEFITPAIRSGNALDIGRSLKNTLADIFTKTEGAAERRAWAEDLGIISRLSDTASAARFSGGEATSMLQSKILAKYFRRTGLTQWTDGTFVAAADLGRVFLRRLSKDMDGGGGKLTKRYLAELGVPEAQSASFAKYALSKRDGMPVAGDLDGPMGDLYRGAIRRFTQQSIMRPDATLRPGWMAHPLGSIAGQLQSFNYAFFENVLKRNARLGKAALTEADYTMVERARMLTPTLMLPMLAASAYAIGEARDAAFGDPERRKEETQGKKLLKAASRGVPIAPLDPLLNYASSARYQRGAADTFSGAVLGTAFRGLDAARNVLLNNSPNTNTAERQTAKAVYDIFIEPTVNLMLTASPVTAAAAVGTQIAGSGRTREAFVGAVADKAKPKKSTYLPQ